MTNAVNVACQSRMQWRSEEGAASSTGGWPASVG